MIVIHIDSQKDTSFLKKCYEGLDDVTLLYNPTFDEVTDTLEQNPTADVMMLGHGSPNGLFSKDWSRNVISYKNAHLLKDRNCIGIWCYAREFARRYGLKGFFTNMFISNEGEARTFGYKADDEDIFNEIVLFSERVRDLYKDGTPLDEWVEILQDSADYDKPFVKYNYNGLQYFDGTQDPWEDTYSSGTTATAYDETTEMDAWFDAFCIENGIEGDWAREVAYPIFKAGWDSYKDSLIQW